MTSQTTSAYILLDGVGNGRTGQLAEYTLSAEYYRAMKTSLKWTRISPLINLGFKTFTIFSLITAFIYWGLNNAYQK